VRRDLTWLSLGLVGGVIGQIVLGGITVLTDLHPVAVQSHFVLSILILTDAIVLHHRASEAPGPYRPTVPGPIRRQVLVAWGLVGLAIVTGTVVTGSGPTGATSERAGSGSPSRRRPASTASRSSSRSRSCLWVAYRIRRGPEWATLGDRLTARARGTRHPGDDRLRAVLRRRARAARRHAHRRRGRRLVADVQPRAGTRQPVRSGWAGAPQGDPSV
jgi:hypothetical protein